MFSRFGEYFIKIVVSPAVPMISCRILVFLVTSLTKSDSKWAWQCVQCAFGCSVNTWVATSDYFPNILPTYGKSDYWCLPNFLVAFFKVVLPVLKIVSSLHFSESKVEFYRLQKTQVTESSSASWYNHDYFWNHFFGTFLFTINGFRELKRLRWLVWLIIHGYFRHGVTTSSLGLFNWTMVILLLLLWLLLRLLQLVTQFEEKTISFCLVLEIFSCLSTTTKK